MHRYLKEVDDRVRSLSAATPAQRKAFRQGYTFSRLPHQEQLAIWDHIWQHSDHGLARSQCVMYCETFCTKPELLESSWTTIVQWQEAVNEWGLCDFLAKIYTKTLEVLPEEVYQKLKEWNRDPNLWKRRQSIVSLLYFQSTKKVHLPYERIIPLIDRLLGDDEYYVQKGVGWALKELYQVYPSQTYQYMTDNIKSISGIAFSPATEKLTTAQKQALKDKRR